MTGAKPKPRGTSAPWPQCSYATVYVQQGTWRAPKALADYQLALFFSVFKVSWVTNFQKTSLFDFRLYDEDATLKNLLSHVTFLVWKLFLKRKNVTKCNFECIFTDFMCKLWPTKMCAPLQGIGAPFYTSLRYFLQNLATPKLARQAAGNTYCAYYVA